MVGGGTSGLVGQWQEGQQTRPLPALGTSSAELGGEARKQELARGPRKSLFHGKLLGIFLYNTCPEPLADPWFLFPPPLSSFLLRPFHSAPSWRSRGV